MLTKQEANSLISGYYAQIENLTGEQNVLSEKIDRLKKAQSAVQAVYEDDKDFASWIDTYDVGPTWQGNRREEFEETKRNAKSATDIYCEQVWNIHERIGEKICELEGCKEELEQQIRSAHTGIANMNSLLFLFPNEEAQ